MGGPGVSILASSVTPGAVYTLLSRRKRNPKSFVMFHASAWCQYCTKLQPMFNLAAKKAALEVPALAIAVAVAAPDWA